MALGRSKWFWVVLAVLSLLVLLEDLMR